MRFVAFLLLVMGCGLGTGCGKNQAATAPDSDVLVRSHFAGLKRLAADVDAPKLREILGMAETKALRNQTVSRLAVSPRILFGSGVSAEQVEKGAALLRPLLDDVLDQESVLEVRGPVERPEWMLAVALSPERKAAWLDNLARLLKLWNLDPPKTATNAGFPTVEVNRPGSPHLIRWIDAGAWLVVGGGNDALPGSDAALQRLKAAGRPGPALSNSIWEVELALGQLRGPLDLPPELFWPRLHLSVSAAGENLRSVARLGFAEAVTGPIPPWHVPTNLIREPLISFTAVRGVAPWLQRSETLARVELKPPPNELYFWAQQAVAFQSFLAFPAADPTHSAERIGQRGSEVLGEGWKKRGFGTIAWQPSTSSAVWKNLPYITPFARAGGDGFVFSGLFPPAPGTNTVPRELLSQIIGRNDLIYYDWEITQHRLSQWRMTSQLLAMLADRSQFTSNMASLRWLVALEPLLGNTVTEISATSPKEWSFTRKSHIGFTGFELVALGRWLESTNFPRLGLEMPREAPSATPHLPVPAAAPQPGPKR